MNEIIREFIKKVESDIYVLIHITSPFITEFSIKTCINKVIYESYDSAFTGTYIKDFLWKDNIPINYDPSNIPRTQDLNNIIKETSGCYVFKKEVFDKYNTRIGKKPYIHIINNKESVDIDTIFDFKLAEYLLDN